MLLHAYRSAYSKEASGQLGGEAMWETRIYELLIKSPATD